MLITVPACKAWRVIPNDQTQHDAELERLIAAVQTYLEAATGRKFDKKLGEVEVFDGRDWPAGVQLARLPILGNVRVWDDPLRAFGAATELPASAVIVDTERGVLTLDGRTFYPGRGNIKVQYDGGYDQAPGDLQQLAIELVWAARQKGEKSLLGVRSQSLGDGNVQYVNLDWPLNGQEILSKYSLRTGVL